MIENFDYALTEFVKLISGAEGTDWNSIMTFFWSAATFLCEEVFILLLIFVLYWAVNKNFAQYVMLNMFFAGGLNSMLKNIVARPRPFTNPRFQKFPCDG